MSSIIRLSLGAIWMAVIMVTTIPLLIVLLPFRTVRIRLTNHVGSLVGRGTILAAGCRFTVANRHNVDTVLEERGSNLSIGQRQLISFARAIVADTEILVLDEATASIDSYTELMIQKALAKLLEGRTGVVIAHRLATIRGADRIIVLQSGRIVEIGNHDELMSNKGLYFRLYSLNYSSFDDIPEEIIREVAESVAGDSGR